VSSSPSKETWAHALPQDWIELSLHLLLGKHKIGLCVQTAMLSRLLVLSFLGTAFGFGQPTIPDTPAGRTLRAWLDAFNSADPAKIETYVHTLDPKQSVDSMTAFRNQTGGFELLSI
jgi:hypothetical protein